MSRIETKKVRVPLTWILGAPNYRKADKVILKEAENDWFLVSERESEGLFGFGGGITLVFQRERR